MKLTPCLALEAPGRCWLTCAAPLAHVCRALGAEAPLAPVRRGCEEAAPPLLDRRAPLGRAAHPRTRPTPPHPTRPVGPRGAGRSLRRGPREALPHATAAAREEVILPTSFWKESGDPAPSSLTLTTSLGHVPASSARPAQTSSPWGRGAAVFIGFETPASPGHLSPCWGRRGGEERHGMF